MPQKTNKMVAIFSYEAIRRNICVSFFTSIAKESRFLWNDSHHFFVNSYIPSIEQSFPQLNVFSGLVSTSLSSFLITIFSKRFMVSHFISENRYISFKPCIALTEVYSKSQRRTQYLCFVAAQVVFATKVQLALNLIVMRSVWVMLFNIICIQCIEIVFKLLPYSWESYHATVFSLRIQYTALLSPLQLP